MADNEVQIEWENPEAKPEDPCEATLQDIYKDIENLYVFTYNMRTPLERIKKRIISDVAQNDVTIEVFGPSLGPMIAGLSQMYVQMIDSIIQETREDLWDRIWLDIYRYATSCNVDAQKRMQEVTVRMMERENKIKEMLGGGGQS